MSLKKKNNCLKKGVWYMKRLLFLILLFFAGLFVYFTYFTADMRQSYETVFTPFIIYLFFAIILLMIIKRGFDFMISR
jgi:hypothetical protein